MFIFMNEKMTMSLSLSKSRFQRTCNFTSVFVVVLLIAALIVGTLSARTGKFGSQRGRGSGRRNADRQILYDHYGRRLRITPKECASTSPRYPDLKGICMFNLECQEESGTVVGACVDRFLFGACCHISDETKRHKILAQGLNSSTEISPGSLENLKNEPVKGPSPTRFPARVSSPSSLDLRVPLPTSRPSGPEPVDPPAPHASPLFPQPVEIEPNRRVPPGHSPGGSGNDLRAPDPRPPAPIERETLTLKMPQIVPLPTGKVPSSKLIIRGAGTTESPKISTFMYINDEVDNDSEASTPTEPELLDSNTENVWNVVMQLGGQDDLLTSLAQPKPVKKKGPGETVSSMMAELVGSGEFKEERTEKVQFFGDFADSSGSTAEHTTEREDLVETTKPWATSTYFVHTFKYPNYTQASEEEFEEKVERTTPSVGKITTWSGIGTVVDKEEFFRDKMTTKRPSTTVKPSTSSTVRTTTTAKSTTTSTSTTTTTTERPTTTTTRATTIPPVVKKYTTRRTTTSSTTTPTTTTRRAVIITEKWRKPAPYTLPPHKRPTTPEALDVPSEEEVEKEEIESENQEQTAQEKTDDEEEGGETEAEIEHEIEVKDPFQGEKESSEEKLPEVEAEDEKPATTKKTPTKKPYKPVKKNQEKEKEKVDKKPVSSSIILDEDMDTNLDDFVEQVVQGLAGSLDNLNIDNVILNGNNHVDEEDPDPVDEADPLVDPLQTTKGNINKNRVETTTTTTTTTSTTTQKPLDWRKDCGVRTLPKSGRIVGGTASKFGRWPWQALVKEATWLGLFSKNKCGGVLIAPKYVLTAAHCQPGFLATLTVVLGEFDISSGTESANAVTKNVRRVIVHRDYNAQTFENDIALLELDSPVDYKSHIVPICMPNDEEEFIGKKAFVTGWGRLKYGGGVPQILHEVDVPILKNDDCQDMFHKSNHLKAIRDSFICAGYAEGFKDSCEGDSGGPLSIQRPNGQWVLAGTVSHGIKCAYPNLPGVYMRMTFYKPWIKRVTGIK